MRAAGIRPPSFRTEQDERRGRSEHATEIRSLSDTDAITSRHKMTSRELACCVYRRAGRAPILGPPPAEQAPPLILCRTASSIVVSQQGVCVAVQVGVLICYPRLAVSSVPSYNTAPCEAPMPFSIRPYRRSPVQCRDLQHGIIPQAAASLLFGVRVMLSL